MRQQIYSILKFVLIFYLSLGPTVIILFKLNEFGLDLTIAGSLWFLVNFLLASLIYYVLHLELSEFWSNYRTLVFIFLIGGLLFWVVLLILNLPLLILLLIFLFVAFILPYVFLRIPDLGLFVGLVLFYLILPGAAILDIMTLWYSHAEVFFQMMLPLSLILAPITFIIIKKFPNRFKKFIR